MTYDVLLRQMAAQVKNICKMPIGL